MSRHRTPKPASPTCFARRAPPTPRPLRPPTGPTTLILTAATTDGRKPFRQELDVDAPRRGHPDGAGRWGALWARRRVEALAARADAEPAVAAALREEATALSIAYRIVGPFTSLVAEDLAVSVKPRAVRKGVLQVVAGPVVLPPFVLDRPKVRVGRVSTADLQLTDPKVSREHCEVVLEGDDWVIRDAHSANGIEVDGKMVRRAVLLPGSRVVVGGCTLRFDRLDDTFAVAPAQRVDVEGPAAADTGAAPQAGGPGKGRAVAEAPAALADDEADFDLDAMLGEGGGDLLGFREGTEAFASSAPEARKRASTTGAPPPPAAFGAPPPAPRPAPRADVRAPSDGRAGRAAVCAGRAAVCADVRAPWERPASVGHVRCASDGHVGRDASVARACPCATPRRGWILLPRRSGPARWSQRGGAVCAVSAVSLSPPRPAAHGAPGTAPAAFAADRCARARDADALRDAHGQSPAAAPA
jgi:hypothetical protein